VFIVKRKHLKKVALTVSALLLTPAFPTAGSVKAEVGAVYTQEDTSSPADNTTEQLINIPDQNLKMAINTLLNKLPYSDVSLSDLQGLYSLNLDNKNIKDLEGLQYAVNLQTLSVNNNAITNLGPLQNLTNLTSLYAGGNQIIDIQPLVKLPNLADLQLTRNQIAELPSLSSLSNLSNLNLGGNHLTNVSSLASLTQLQQLDLSANQLTDISPLHSLSNLVNLTLSFNQINDISSITNLTNLEGFFLVNGEIADVSPLASLTKLRDLNLSNNHITDIRPLENLTNLAWLFIGSNQISDIGPMGKLTNLIDIDLSQNQLDNISTLANKSIVWRMNLSGNRIKDLQPLANMTNLSNLELDSNQISDISPLAKLSKLTYLRLASNQIADIGPLAKLTNLSSLDLSVNRIWDLSPLANLSLLNTLSLGANQIDNLDPLNYLKKLKSLDVVRNFILGKSYQYSYTVPTAYKEIPLIGSNGVKIPIEWLLSGRQIQLPDTDFKRLLNSITLKSKNNHVTASFDDTGAILIQGINNGTDEIMLDFSNPNLDQTIKISQVDIEPPAKPIVNPVGDNATSVTGTTEPGTEVVVQTGNDSWTSKANDQGSFAVSMPKQTAGTKLMVTAADQGGNVSLVSEVTVKDVTPPNAPTVHQVTDKSTSITGSAEANSTITVKSGTSVLGTLKINEDGTFSVPIGLQKEGTKLTVTATDKAGNVSEEAILTVIYKIRTVVRIAGDTRFDTSVEIAKKGWQSANTVVIATGYDFPDALAGSPLAYKLNAPILLTNSNGLSDSTKREITNLKATSAIILGGTIAVPFSVEQQLKSLGITNIERLAGANRFETASMIAAKMGGNPNTAILADGFNYPDALSVASYAAQNGFPILLTRKDVIPSETSNQLAGKVRTIVVGGEAAISNEVFKRVPGAERVGGADRYETAANLISKLQLSTDKVFVATGRNFADALTGSVLAAKEKAPVLLVEQNYIPNSIKNLFISKGIENVDILGGNAAVSSSVESQLKK
jgi:Leucine-rich repeat (LRR) protein/putative cell wall-binding protein